VKVPPCHKQPGKCAHVPLVVDVQPPSKSLSAQVPTASLAAFADLSTLTLSFPAPERSGLIVQADSSSPSCHSILRI
jgi:hypothetical protein